MAYVVPDTEAAEVFAALSQSQKMALCTYCWECVECGHVTYTARAGGVFDECCGATSDAAKVRVFTLLAGDRRDLGLLADIVTNGLPPERRSYSPEAAHKGAQNPKIKAPGPGVG
jgi:hypothetical protein